MKWLVLAPTSLISKTFDEMASSHCWNGRNKPRITLLFLLSSSHTSTTISSPPPLPSLHHATLPSPWTALLSFPWPASRRRLGSRYILGSPFPSSVRTSMVSRYAGHGCTVQIRLWLRTRPTRLRGSREKLLFLASLSRLPSQRGAACRCPCWQ